ncbi:hypothetical protein H2198_007433 [Neophaeococcomyces mojaviensis]|uniref:Uncharacterized protein n=1 Tax=Neophaeococcomyces mojaviensis TaxID=3383035 RepID=A0ACC3A0R1_9EURO|nr:hypothetical protein H2198_007433 [Knufia sp. JES_112]
MVSSSRTSEYVVVPDADKRNGVTATTAEVEMDDLSSNERRHVVSDTDSAHSWQPGFWRQFPWLGLGCLLGSLLLTFAALGVLLASNGKAVSQWSKTIAPNVILSLLTSGASVCIALAVSEGICIAWWRRSLRGASIEELHHSWSFGSSFGSILFGYRFFNICALAALVTKFTIIDAVLFQRSTTTYVALGPKGSVGISTYPTKYLPTTGDLNDYANDTRILAHGFTYDVATWVNSAVGSVYSTYGFVECEGICFVEVPVPGYMVTCSNTTQLVDPIAAAIARQNDSAKEVKSQFNLFDVNFNINFEHKNSSYHWIGMNLTSYTMLDLDPSDPKARCPGELVTQTCELRPALLSYPIYMQFTNITSKGRNNHLSKIDVYIGDFDDTNGTYVGLSPFDYDHKQIPGFKFLNWTTFSSVAPGPLSETINGGIMAALRNQYKSRAYITTSSLGGDNWTLSTENQLAGIHEDSPLLTGYEAADWYCPYSYINPIDTIVSGLNTLTFITADDLWNRKAYTDSTDVWNDTRIEAYINDNVEYVQALQYKSEVHYSTNIAYMVAAVVSSFVCVACVLPAFWGWWELGRKVTLNPIEVANAFQAPVLAAVHSGTGHADDVIKAAGGQMVRYEEVYDEKCGKKYTFVVR